MMETILNFITTHWEWFVSAAGIPVVKMALDFIARKLKVGDKASDLFDAWGDKWNVFFEAKIRPYVGTFAENLGIGLTSWWQKKIPLLNWFYQTWIEPVIEVLVSGLARLLQIILDSFSALAVIFASRFVKGLRSDNHDFKSVKDEQ